ncbi:MAG: ubiquinone biosynthesis protein [Bacillota bacterium]|nr:ubiquinone biosynthesis protein [Bacillota bacterium]
MLFRYGFGYLIDQLDLKELLSPFDRARRMAEQEAPSRGVRLRRALTDLGPTFIKLGQLLSTRPDLLPPDVVSELAKLQDRVPPFPFAEVRQVIAAELGQEVDEVFASFDPEPIGSASLGQVHQATLPDGRQVVVKVQRPGVARIVRNDLLVLADLARLADRRTPWGRIYNFSNMVEEFSRSLNEELDYTAEARHAERLAAAFRDDPNVHIPRVLWELTTTRVLTQEYLAGIKLEDRAALQEAGYSLPRLAEKLARAMVRQILEVGYFHADPHPGNILVLPGEVIGFLDFGLVGYLSQERKEAFLRLILAVHRHQTDVLVQGLKELGTTTAPLKEAELRQDIELLLDKYYGLPLARIRLGQAIRELMDVAFRHHLRLPADFTLLAKALLTLEGVVTDLDPGLSLLQIIEPVARDYLQKRLAPRYLLRVAGRWLSEYLAVADELPRLFKTLLEQVTGGELKVSWELPELEASLRRLDRISNRLSFSMVLLAFSIIMASLILGSAIISPTTGARSLLWRLPILELGFLTAGIMVGWLIWAIFRSGRI